MVKKKAKKAKPKARAHTGTSSRKLAAIMFTDMVGYTALGQKNEALSFSLVNEQRILLRPKFKMYNGREIKTIGDAFLVEFQSALDATKCAYDIQKTLNISNISSPANKKIVLRIGVHLGDVLEGEDGDIAGDAVNLASRIEPLAENGGVCLTRQVYDDVQNKLDVEIRSIGFKALKNVSKPIEVYKIVMPWQEKTAKVIPLRTAPKTNPSQFFGREKELSFLLDQLDSVIEKNHGAVVLIGGEAGIGKTSLVESFISKLPKREILIVRGYCLADISIPYFPFVKALGTLLQARDENENATEIVNWFIDPEIISRTARPSREQIFELIVRKLSEESFKGTLILFLDDLHWADSASLALLHYLARNTRERKVLILGTYRTEELADLGQGNPHPLSETIRLMNREALILKLELSGLETKIIHKVTSSIINGASDPVLELIAKESEGNPFYAVESSRFLLDSNALKSTAGFRVLKEIQVPSSILDIIGRRLSHLRDEERQLLNCASIIGEHFDTKIVASALGLDELSTIQAFANLSRNTHLVLEEGEFFRFEHAKIKESVSREIGVALSKAIHRRVAYAMVNLYGSKRVQELAYHYHAAGMKKETIGFGIIAGDQAKTQFAYAESANCYEWVIEAANDDVDQVDTKASALAKKADLLSLQGLHQQAIKASEEALAISKNSRVRFLALRVSAVSWRKMGHFTESLDCINRGEREHEREKIEYLKLLEEKALILSYKNDPNAQAVWRELGQGYLDEGGKREYAHAILALDESPNTKDPIQLRHEALKIYEELGDLAGQVEVYFDLADYITLHSGEVREAEENYRKGIQIASKIGNFDSIVWSYLYWSILLEAAGNYEESLAMGLKSIEASKLAEAPYPETGAYCVLVRCYLRLNKMEDAEKVFATMNYVYERHSKDSSQGMRSFVARTKGFRFAYLNKWKDADEAYQTSVNLLGGGWGAHEPNSRREYAEWLIKQDRKDEALEELSLAFTKYQELQNKHGMEITKEMMKRIG